MSDYIKREDAERAIQEDIDTACMPYEWVEGMNDALDDLDGVPSADVVKTRHAKWQLIHRDRNFYKDVYQCSECRFLVTGAQEIAYDYCPYCGARMDGGNDECK